MAKNKKCSYPGCITILESNNDGPCCHIHQQPWIDLLEDRINRLEIRISQHKKYIHEALRVEQHKINIVNLDRRIKKLRKRKKIAYLKISDN